MTKIVTSPRPINLFTAKAERTESEISTTASKFPYIFPKFSSLPRDNILGLLANGIAITNCLVPNERKRKQPFSNPSILFLKRTCHDRI